MTAQYRRQPGRGVVEGAPIVLSPRVQIVPVVAWAEQGGESAPAVTRVIPLAVLAATPNGIQRVAVGPPPAVPSSGVDAPPDYLTEDARAAIVAAAFGAPASDLDGAWRLPVRASVLLDPVEHCGPRTERLPEEQSGDLVVVGEVARFEPS